jgi:hypothetical protein
MNKCTIEMPMPGYTEYAALMNQALPLLKAEAVKADPSRKAIVALAQAINHCIELMAGQTPSVPHTELSTRIASADLDEAFILAWMRVEVCQIKAEVEGLAA